MYRFQLMLPFLLAIVLLHAARPAVAQFGDLTRRIPDGANMILLMQLCQPD